MVAPSKQRTARGSTNPFKESATPGCSHWVWLGSLALLVTVGLLLTTEQGHEDAQQFHQQHIAKHLHHTRHGDGQGPHHHHHQHHDRDAAYQKIAAHNQNRQRHREAEEEEEEEEEEEDSWESNDSQDDERQQVEADAGADSNEREENRHEEEEMSHGENEEKDSEEDEEEEEAEIELEEEPEGAEFPKLAANKFPKWLHTYAIQLHWGSHIDSDTDPHQQQQHQHHNSQQHHHGHKLKLNRHILTESFTLGCRHLTQQQHTHQGNFVYQFNWVHDEENDNDEEDSQVRQAGALWGVALCFQHMVAYENPASEITLALRLAVDKALGFFLEHTVEGPVPHSLVVHYPDQDESDLGTSALFGLALIDYIVTVRQNPTSLMDIHDSWMKTLESTLKGIVEYLLDMQLPPGHFRTGYNVNSEQKQDPQHVSPYYDGEALLCLVRAAKYLPYEYHDQLLPILDDTVPFLLQTYTVDAWHHGGVHDSDLTKGFSQWSLLTMSEYIGLSQQHQQLAVDYTMAMSHWIIHTHRIVSRRKNTGYAYEGLAAVYSVLKRLERQGNETPHALQLDHLEACLHTLRVALDHGLHKLTAWQVGGPLSDQNPFLVQHHDAVQEQAIGGVMNAQDDVHLRIDTTQHQMHAVRLVLESDLYGLSSNQAMSRQRYS